MPGCRLPPLSAARAGLEANRRHGYRRVTSRLLQHSTCWATQCMHTALSRSSGRGDSTCPSRAPVLAASAATGAVCASSHGSSSAPSKSSSRSCKGAERVHSSRAWHGVCDSSDSSRACSDAWQVCRSPTAPSHPAAHGMQHPPGSLRAASLAGWAPSCAGVPRCRPLMPPAAAARRRPGPPPGQRGEVAARQGECACGSVPGECAQIGVAARRLQLAAGATAGVGAQSLACQLSDTRAHLHCRDASGVCKRGQALHSGV